MSYYGASVFYGFMIPEEYSNKITKELRAEPDRKYRVSPADVCEKIAEIIGDFSPELEVNVTGDEDCYRYSIVLKDRSEYISFSDVKSISLDDDCAKIDFGNLMDTKKKLGLPSKDDIGWYLAASEG